jgi:Cu+-exporting ATPase
VEAAKERGITLPSVSDFQSATGEGVKGVVEGKEVRIGKLSFVQPPPSGGSWFESVQNELKEGSQTALYVSIEGKAAGMILVADPIKDSAHRAVQELHRMGKKIVMVTGDASKTAEAVARNLGIDEWAAGAAPSDKQAYVKNASRGQGLVAMVGDGINDAPALAAADVGIAMGTGTDAAIESGEVTLIKGDLAGIVQAMRLSRAMMRNIRENLFFSFLYNSVGVFLAAGVLYPWTGVLLNPMIAALAMICSSLSVVGNALRLRRLKL